LKKNLEITGHRGAIYTQCLIDKNTLFTGSADGYVASWDLKTGQQNQFSINCARPVYSLAFNPDFNHLWIALNNGDQHVIELVSKKEIKYFQQHRSAVFSSLHLDKLSMMVCSDADGNLSIWDSKNLKLLLFLPLLCGKIRKLSCNSDQSLLLINAQDSTLRVFETTGFNEIITLPGHKEGTCSSLFSPLDESLIISGGKDGLLKVWDWEKEKLTKEIPAHHFAIYDLVTDSSNSFLYSSSRDKSIKKWNLKDLSFVEKVELKQGGHKHSVNSLSIHKNELISSGDDSKIVTWII
jgi:WD40 repeat protein